MEIESTNKALVLTRIASTDSIANPVNGMIVYDLSTNCIKGYENGAWTDCYGATVPSVEVICGGFLGTYNANFALSGAQYRITLVNNSFNTATIALQTSDLVISGIVGYTVSGVSTSSVTLTAGQSAIVNYTISGTASSPGTLIGNWSKLNLSCTNTQAITWAPVASVNGSNGPNSPDNAYHRSDLLTKGPYAAKTLSAYSTTALDGNLTLTGDIMEDELNVSNSVVYSSAGATTWGAASGSTADNTFHTVICPNNTIATGIEIYSTIYFDWYMKLQCTAVNPGYSTDLGAGNVDANGPGVTADNQTHTATCPVGEYIKGVRIYASGGSYPYLDGDIGLYCTQIY